MHFNSKEKVEVEAGDAGVFLVLVQLQRGEVELFSQTGALGTHWQREWWPDQLAGLAKTCNDTFAVSQEFDFHLQCFCRLPGFTLGKA